MSIQNLELKEGKSREAGEARRHWREPRLPHERCHVIYSSEDSSPGPSQGQPTRKPGHTVPGLRSQQAKEVGGCSSQEGRKAEMTSGSRSRRLLSRRRPVASLPTISQYYILVKP